MSRLGSPSMIHSAIMRPAPPPAAIPKALKPTATKTVVQLRRRPHDGIAVRCKGFRPVDQPGDTGLLQARGALHGRVGELLEVIEIRLQQLRDEIVGHPVDAPGNSVAFIAAHDHAADLFLVVEQVVLVPDGGKIRRQAFDHLGDQKLVLEGHQRRVDPQHRTDLPAPHAGAVDHDLALDVALVGLDGGHPFFVEVKTGHQGVFIDLAAPAAGPLGHGLGNAGRIGLPVGGHEGGTDQIVQGNDREQRSLASSGVMMFISSPKLRAVVAPFFSSYIRSLVSWPDAGSRVFFQPVVRPVSSSSFS